MQNEHFIPGKDASLEHAISSMQAKLLARGFDIAECTWLNPVAALIGLQSPGTNLTGCDLHQRLLQQYKKVHAITE